jgi:hypothetical protein
VIEDNDYEAMKIAVDEAMKNSPHIVSKLDVIRMILSIDTLKMLDDLLVKLEKESYSKDYLGGLRHARYEVKAHFATPMKDQS